MSYQEKNITVSLISYLLVAGYYLVNLFQMLQEGGLVSTRLFSLWGIVIIAILSVNIVGSILANIILSIIQAIKTGSNKVEQFIADERDTLIKLKGVQVSYLTFSAGVLLSMLTFVFGQSPLIMFGLIIFSSLAAGITGGISKIYLYRKGF